ncbi:MAG: hypothetical protein QXY62_03200 [Candidatus Altiarchaeota archaeon]
MKIPIIVIFTVFALVLIFCSVIFAFFQGSLPDSSEIYMGDISVGGVPSPQGTNVSVYNNNTGEFLAEYFTPENEPSRYSLSITVTESVNSTDKKANTGDKLRFKVNGVDCISPYPGEYSITAVPGGLPPFPKSVNLSVAATCFDRAKNGNETDTDCDGTCTRCYAMSVTPTLISKILKQNQSETENLTIKNLGYHNITDLTLNISDGCVNMTFTLTPNSIALLNGSGSGISTNGQITYVLLNASVWMVAEGVYNCALLINSTSNLSQIINITIHVSSLDYFSIYLQNGWNLISFPLEVNS